MFLTKFQKKKKEFYFWKGKRNVHLAFIHVVFITIITYICIQILYFIYIVDKMIPRRRYVLSKLFVNYVLKTNIFFFFIYCISKTLIFTSYFQDTSWKVCIYLLYNRLYVRLLSKLCAAFQYFPLSIHRACFRHYQQYH